MVREAAKHEMGVTQCVAGAPWCTDRYRIEPYRNIDYRKFVEYRTLFGTVFGTDIDTIISKSSIRYTTLLTVFRVLAIILTATHFVTQTRSIGFLCYDLHKMCPL